MKNIKLITSLMIAILVGIQFSYGQLKSEKLLAPKACIGYTIEMSNLNGGVQTFRYLNCDGLEVVIIQAQKTGPMTYTFCGFESQTIEREDPFIVGDVFTVTEGACNQTHLLKEYTVNLSSSDGGNRPKPVQEGLQFSDKFGSNIATDESFNAEVFPNPTHGNATLRWDEDEVTTLVIVDLSGKKVLNQVIAKGTTTTSFTLTDPGVYFVLIEQNGEKKWAGKVVKL